MSNSNDNYMGMLLEQIRDEVKAVHELVVNQPTRHEFNELKEDTRKIQDDVRVIKAATTDQSKQLYDHEQRITHLEADAA